MRRLLAGLCAAALSATFLPASGVQRPGPTPAAADADGHRQRAYEAARSHPIEDLYYPAKGDFRLDALHYGLDLRWAPEPRLLQGTATIAYRVMKSTPRIGLDLGHPLHISSVRLDGRRVHARHRHDHLSIATGRLPRLSRHTLRITYAGTPHPTAAPTTRADIPALGWTTTRSGAVWTMQEPFGAFTWYPVSDQPSDKAFYDATIDVPARWVGVLNGEMTSRVQRHGRTLTSWHLASPAASYLMTIAIGDYVRHRDRGPHGLPITYWVPAAHRHRFLPTLRATPAMVRWLEHTLGRFPFDRIGAVVVPSASAMETQTLVTMGSGIFGQPWTRGDLLHELSHQWYGDTVTPDNWKDLWLNESFAMYVQTMWGTSHGSPGWPYWVRYWSANDELWRNEDGPPGAYHRTEFGQGCVYYCGALMLRHLRHRVGAGDFAHILRAWPQQHDHANADRTGYIHWLNHQTGRHLGHFIRTWLTSRRSLVH